MASNEDAGGGQFLSEALGGVHVVVVGTEQGHMFPAEVPAEGDGGLVGTLHGGESQGCHVDERGG